MKKMVLAALLLMALPLSAFAGGGSTGRATEKTQLANNEELIGIAGIDAEALENAITTAENTLKHYEHAVEMASKITAFDVLGLTNQMNRLRKVVSSAISLYDRLEKLPDVLEEAYEGHKKKFTDLGFDDIRSFARQRKQRYMEDVFQEMQRGSAALENLEELQSNYDLAVTKIDASETYNDLFRMNAHILNESRLQLGQISQGIEMVATANAQYRAQSLEREMQEDLVIDEWTEEYFEPWLAHQDFMAKSNPKVNL